MFYQTYTARKPPKVPVTVQSRHPVTPGGHGMVPSAAACYLHVRRILSIGMTQQFSVFCPWWSWPSTFNLDIQTCPSERPNVASLWIWRKSVQPFLIYLIHKQTQTNKQQEVTDSAKTEPYLRAVKTDYREDSASVLVREGSLLSLSLSLFVNSNRVHNWTLVFSRGCLLPRLRRTDVHWSQIRLNGPEPCVIRSFWGSRYNTIRNEIFIVRQKAIGQPP